MRINRTAFIIFLSTFLVGCVSFAMFIYVVRMRQNRSKTKQIAVETKNAVYTPTDWAQPKSEAENAQEESVDVAPNYKIKLLTTGEFHGDEIQAKSGEFWLGLFKENTGAFLKPVKIKVTRVHDDIVDENPKEKTGKKVTVAYRSEPILLLKNADMLRRGKVITLFSQTDADENNLMLNGFAKDFNLNGTNYTLKVVSNNQANEYLDDTSKLVLVSGKTEQVVYKSGGCNDCGWSLYWVGDLDKDGKLDLFADINHHYNVTTRRLFLSSQAKEGKLVKEVAVFTTVGC